MHASETRVYTYGAAAARGAVAVRAAGSAGARVHFGGWRGKVPKVGRRLYKRWCANWRYSRRLSEPWLKRREEKRRGGKGRATPLIYTRFHTHWRSPSLPLFPPSHFFPPLHHTHVPRQVGPRHTQSNPTRIPSPPLPALGASSGCCRPGPGWTRHAREGASGRGLHISEPLPQRRLHARPPIREQAQAFGWTAARVRGQ